MLVSAAWFGISALYLDKYRSGYARDLLVWNMLAAFLQFLQCAVVPLLRTYISKREGTYRPPDMNDDYDAYVSYVDYRGEWCGTLGGTVGVLILTRFVYLSWVLNIYGIIILVNWPEIDTLMSVMFHMIYVGETIITALGVGWLAWRAKTLCKKRSARLRVSKLRMLSDSL
jgi:hypothetical protein